MQKSPEAPAAESGVKSSFIPDMQLSLKQRLKLLGALTVALLLCFAVPLCRLVRFSLHSDLYSYVPLVPFISVYLAWLKRDSLTKVRAWRPAYRPAPVFAVIGISLLALTWLAPRLGWSLSENDLLCLLTLSFVFFFWSACVIAIGNIVWRILLFPAAFLIFMAPLPSVAENCVEAFLQHGSAGVAYAFLKIAGTPVLREGTLFHLPRISPINVAPECSGIHSTAVLFMVGLIAAHLFLRKPWTKVLLVLSVVVLGILRNAFRIFVLCELCVHVNPNFIDSPLHHRGGPIFFAISLVPFLFLVWIVKKIDGLRSSTTPK